MIKLELSEGSPGIWQILKQEYKAIRSEQLERKEARVKSAQQMVDAAGMLFNTYPEIEEQPAIRITLRNKRVRIDRGFESKLGFPFDGSEELLLDFIQELTGKPPKTIFGYEGSGAWSIRAQDTFDLGNKIPGYVLNRELLPDKTLHHDKNKVITYTFVKKEE